jgi:hypothetical protein
MTVAAYAAHPDPVTAACNRIALLVASSQPTWPLYLWWLVGGEWPVACWTFLSTPLFLAVPALARRRGGMGRGLLVVAGVGNAVLATMALGVASGVELFLLPTLMLAVMGFAGWQRLAMVALNLAAGALHGFYGAPWGHFSRPQQEHLLRLNLGSVTVLCVVIGVSLRHALRQSRCSRPWPSQPCPSPDRPA